MEIEGQVQEGYAEGEEPLVFHYSRERRLENAPDVVKDFYENGISKPRGFFGILFARKGNKVLFFVMMMTFVVSMFFSYFGPKKSEGAIGNVKLSLVAFSFEGEIYASVKAEKNDARKKIKNMNAVFQFRGIDREGITVFEETHSSFFTDETFNPEKKENFLRTKFTDYDIIRMECCVSDGKNEILLWSKIEKR